MITFREYLETFQVTEGMTFDQAVSKAPKGEMIVIYKKGDQIIPARANQRSKFDSDGWKLVGTVAPDGKVTKNKSLDEAVLDRMRKMVDNRTDSALVNVGGKMKKVSLRDASFAIQLYDNQTSSNKKIFDQQIEDGKGFERIMKIVRDNLKESFIIESKSATGYDIYHKTFSGAVQHAIKQVEKQGYTVDEDEWDRKVALGPKKPSKGKTNSYTISLLKGGKETKRKLQMQVYYDEGRFELNMYVS